MEKSVIREYVAIEIKKWTILQKKRNLEVSFTPKAIDFLCLMIENIQEDKSNYWDIDGFDGNDAQEVAISLIPNAFNNLIIMRRSQRRPRFSRVNEIQISSWEIWHSLDRILVDFCFIPKNI